jgi:hypothetical protein
MCQMFDFCLKYIDENAIILLLIMWLKKLIIAI